MNRLFANHFVSSESPERIFFMNLKENLLKNVEVGIFYKKELAAKNQGKEIFFVFVFVFIFVFVFWSSVILDCIFVFVFVTDARLQPGSELQ